MEPAKSVDGATDGLQDAPKAGLLSDDIGSRVALIDARRVTSSLAAVNLYVRK